MGIPIGILMSRSDRVQAVIGPGPGRSHADHAELRLFDTERDALASKVPGLIAVVIYAIPPMIRLDQSRHQARRQGCSGSRRFIRFIELGRD